MVPLGVMIEGTIVDMDRWRLVLDWVHRLLLVALPLIRIILRARDRLRVLKISVGEPQRITPAPPAASSQEPKKEPDEDEDEDGRAQGWSAADA